MSRGGFQVPGPRQLPEDPGHGPRLDVLEWLGCHAVGEHWVHGSRCVILEHRMTSPGHDDLVLMVVDACWYAMTGSGCPPIVVNLPPDAETGAWAFKSSVRPR